MKKLFVIFLFCLSLTAAAQNQIKRVAILETVDKEGTISYMKLLQFRSNLTTAITNTEGYEGYDRADLKQIIGEQNFQRTGLVSDADIKKIGQFTGAQYVLIAEAAVDGNNMFITAKIIDVETARVLRNSNQLMGTSAAEMQEGSLKVAADLLGIKDVDDIFNLNTTSKEKLIYTQDKKHEQYCDGKYGDRKYFFYEKLDDLNRKHFRIIFAFEAFDFAYTFPLMLSRGCRVLGISLHENGSIFIETDNGDFKYSTGLTYIAGHAKEIDLEYNNGLLTINGKKIEVLMDEYCGDNDLSSINFSRGIAFYGRIYFVRVYNIED